MNGIKFVLAVMFLICLAPMPYGYYQMVRFLGMLGFAVLAYNEYNSGSENMAFFYGASALLINPFFKVALGRTLWNIVDIIWAVVLLSSLLKKK
jgi:hypothetical protein